MSVCSDQVDPLNSSVLAVFVLFPGTPVIPPKNNNALGGEDAVEYPLYLPVFTAVPLAHAVSEIILLIY